MSLLGDQPVSFPVDQFWVDCSGQGAVMRKSKFSETQIVGIVKGAESGVPVADLLRKYGVSKATFFKWRSKRWGVGVRCETAA
jgi:hypothetical protein